MPLVSLANQIMSHRPQRINAEMMRALNEIVSNLKDTRIDGMVSVLSCDVTKDLKFCKALVSVFGAADPDATIAALNGSGGFVRREVAARFRHLRTVPEVTFVLDRSIEHGDRIGQILEEIKNNEE